MQRDVEVIGGGPIGLYAAYLLARNGFNVRVWEEHREIGKPEHCTGIISPALEKFVKSVPVLNEVNGAVFFAGKEKAMLERKKAAFIVDRPALDKEIAEMAESEGARIELGKRKSWKEFKGKIIAADGALSKTRHDLGQRIDFLPALQFDVRERVDDFAELWFEPWNPDFFVWVVPHADFARVGTAGNVNGLADFIRRRFGRKRIFAKYSGLVIISGPVKKTYFKMKEREIFLVGDAAGQVKPTTGGGIVTGLICARELAFSLIEGKGWEYERRWKKKLGREFFMQKIARKLMISNPRAFVRFLRRSKAKLELFGDMDMQTSVAFKIIPQLFFYFVDLVKLK